MFTVRYIAYDVGDIENGGIINAIITVFDDQRVIAIYAAEVDWNNSHTKIPVGRANMFYRKIDANASMYIVQDIDDISRFSDFFSRFKPIGANDESNN